MIQKNLIVQNKNLIHTNKICPVTLGKVNMDIKSTWCFLVFRQFLDCSLTVLRHRVQHTSVYVFRISVLRLHS